MLFVVSLHFLALGLEGYGCECRVLMICADDLCRYGVLSGAFSDTSALIDQGNQGHASITAYRSCFPTISDFAPAIPHVKSHNGE